MRAKQVAFDVTYIDLGDKPDWFLEISPHGKVPVLSVDGQPLFESNAIAEYLDETVAPRLHPEDPVRRARHRAWTDFAPDFASALSGVYWTKGVEEIGAKVETAARHVAKLEEALAAERSGDGPYFNDRRLCLVDAAYAPFLQRFAFVEGQPHAEEVVHEAAQTQLDAFLGLRRGRQQSAGRDNRRGSQ